PSVGTGLAPVRTYAPNAPDEEQDGAIPSPTGCVPSVGTGLAPVRAYAPNAPDEEQDGHTMLFMKSMIGFISLV
ncbi:MAG: hypothetical protein RR696_13345, partial [Clostridia bacterium]